MQPSAYRCLRFVSLVLVVLGCSRGVYFLLRPRHGLSSAERPTVPQFSSTVPGRVAPCGNFSSPIEVARFTTKLVMADDRTSPAKRPWELGLDRRGKTRQVRTGEGRLRHQQ